MLKSNLCDLETIMHVGGKNFSKIIRFGAMLIREFRAGRVFKENGKKIENRTYLFFSLIGRGEILLNHANDCQKMPN